MPDLAYLQENPYLTGALALTPDQKREALMGAIAHTLIGLGSGISRAGMAGQPWMAGVAPGFEIGSNAIAADQDRMFRHNLAAANYAQTEAYRRAQEDALKSQTAERDFQMELAKKLTGGAPGDATLGFSMQPPAVQMGAQPGGGVNSNNVGNVRPVGSNTDFQQPPTFDDGVALAVKNVRAYPQAFNQGQPMTLMKIGERWAPKGDGANDPKAWAFNVSRFSGLPADQPLDFNNPQVAAAFARGVHGAEHGAGAIRPIADYSGGVQLAQAGGSPTNPPPGSRAPNVQPPRVDALRYAPYTMSKYLAPYGRSMIDIGNKETDRWLADQDRAQRQQQFERTQGGVERNAAVGPSGTPNQALIDAKAAKAAAEAEALRKAELEYEASTKLTQDAVARYEKEVRPGALAAANGLPNLYEMKRLADSPIAAGPFMDTRQFGARVADWLGLGDMSDPMLSRTGFNNRAAKNVLAVLQTRALGSGTGISEGDRQFVQKTAASGGDFTQEELKRLIGIGIQSSTLAIDQHGQEVGRLSKLPGMGKVDKGYFDILAPSYAEWAKANPPVAAAMPAPAGTPAPSGQAAPPAPGFIKDGYRFKGGDPRQKMNWELVR